MLIPGSPAVLSVMLAAYFIMGVSFARDQRRAEQVLGDDDPITLPTSVVPETSTQLPRDLDPEHYRISVHSTGRTWLHAGRVVS